MRNWLKRSIFATLIIGTVVAAFAWQSQSNASAPVVFNTATLTRGDVIATISATGTLEPEEVVDVGAQVAGKVLSRTVDYGSHIEAGTVLAKIDDSMYAAALAQAEAQLRVDKANLARASADLNVLNSKLDQSRLDGQQATAHYEQAQANIQQAQVRLDQARRNWDRVGKIDQESGAITQEAYETYKTTLDDAQAALASSTAAASQARIAIDSSRTSVVQAQASVASGEAAIAQAEANVAKSQAAADGARLNVGYCTIQSPVNGVVIDRRVNIGQTVVASLNAPSLFLIAKDLKHMQVWVAVNEADIGRIKAGQPVRFTVDAFPGEHFRGEVSKVRLNASMTQNVVTYTVEIVTDNASGRLLPYLTANVRFEVARADNVLVAPVSALHWIPATEQIAPEFRGESAAGKDDRGTAGKDDGSAATKGTLWVRDGQYVKPLAVATGLSNGLKTEVKPVDGAGALSEGLEIVTGVDTSRGRQAGSNNPFALKIPRPPKSAGGPPL